ncbi:unnamed protein product [Rhizoctonia solani]|uniref:Uncharacterized protein n=1 Tax=Rhizoctonia solani TaxID=456999 RepID=A0A8H2WES7_9AGAM|nr:unnamed protein product [Rhizoctonia solani]
MSAASSLPPPLAQLPVCGEHLSVHTKMDAINSYQSLPSTGQSLEEIQLGLDVQTDDISMNEDRAQIDELEEELDEGLQYPSGSDPNVNGEPEPAESFKLVEKAHGQNDVTPAASDQARSLEEPTEEPPQTDIEINSLVSQTDAILQAETLGAATTTDNSDYVSLEDNLDISEGEDMDFSVPLTEQELSVMAQNFTHEIEQMTAKPDDLQPSEPGSNLADLQTVESEPIIAPEPIVESHQDVGAPPLRRMDDETIPVTAHSKDSIIDILNTSNAPIDDSVQSATATEQPLQESEVAASTEVVPEQMDMELDARIIVQLEEPTLEEPTSASAMVHVEDVQVLEQGKEGEGDDIMVEQKQEQVVIEQNGEPDLENTIDPKAVQITQDGSNPTAQDEPTASDPALDDPTTASGDVTGSIVTVIEQSATIAEQTPVQETEQAEPFAADPGPEAAMNITTTSVTATVISTEPIVVDSVLSTTAASETEADPIELAVQIQQEQDATVQTTEGETQATLVTEPIATPNNTTVTGEVSDPMAPKDNDSPLRRAASQSQSQPQSDPVTPQTADPVDPLVAQDAEPDIPEENSEATRLQQQQVSPDEPKAMPDAEPLNNQTPPWEGFAALDGDAQATPEPEPSSELSEHPDEDAPLNPTSASTDKAEEPKEPSNLPTAPVRKKKKPRMIMEVVIPIARRKPKVAQETKPAEKKARATKSVKAPAPKQLELVTASSSSSQRRSSSADAPSVKSESPEPALELAPRVKQYRSKRPRPPVPRKGLGTIASGSNTGARPVRAIHTGRLEVVIPSKPKPSVLKTRRTSSGNNVKFASASPVTGKRKAESEPEVKDEGSDADADGETDEEYEDVEEEADAAAQVARSSRPQKKAVGRPRKASPIKRPRRSYEARKPPAKLPKTVSKASRSPPKRRRLRR